MFINSLSAIFAFEILFSPLEFVSFLALILGAVYYEVPKVNIAWTDRTEKNFYFLLQACWLGQASLWRAFWPFFILANIAFFYIDYRSLNLTYTIASWRTVHLMLFLPSVWWLISVWKCSANTNKNIWPLCARAITIYFSIDYFLRLYLSFKYPYLLFDCKLLVLEYGDCV